MQYAIVVSMDLAAVKAFVEVGDVGGFRSAAAALGMTSAGVSKAVARLEADVGTTLVARTTRSVRLTAAGALFHARCKIILADLDEAGREAAASSSVAQGRVVIGMTKAFGRTHVLPVIADYLAAYPNVEVEARFSDEAADLVDDGVDLAIRIGHLPDSGLIVSRISHTRFILCGSPAYLSRHGVPAHPNDLHAHVVVGYVAPGTATRFAYRFMVDGRAATLNLPARLTVDDGEALVVAGVRSSGLIMANDYLMERPLADGSLIRILGEFEMPSIPISAVYLPARTLSPAVTAFVGMLRQRLGAFPDRLGGRTQG